MKSTFFSKKLVDIDDDAVKMLSTLTELSSEQLSGFAAWFNKRDPKTYGRRLQFGDVQALNNLCAECRLGYNDIKNINRFVEDIFEKAYEYKDDVKNILDDIEVQKGGFDKEKVNAFFELMKEKGFEIAKRSKIVEYEKRDLPVLSALRFNVNLRLVPVKELDLADTSVEAYEPMGDALVPVAIFEMILNDGQKRTSHNFQVNIDELEDIIGALQSSQKQLRLLETYSKKISFEK